MRYILRLTIALFVFIGPSAQFVPAPQAASSRGQTIEAFLAPGYPTELVSARRADRVAWTAYEHGLRNVYAASAPDFKPVRLTSFLKDDGIELSDIRISDDGATVVFVRRTPPNREGWVANPTGNPAGADRTIWAARTAGGAAWKLGEGTTPELSPDGASIVFAKEGQIYALPVRLKAAPTTAGSADPPTASATSSKSPVGSGFLDPPKPSGEGGSRTSAPLIKAWGTNSNPKWSPARTTAGGR